MGLFRVLESLVTAIFCAFDVFSPTNFSSPALISPSLTRSIIDQNPIPERGLSPRLYFNFFT